MEKGIDLKKRYWVAKYSHYYPCGFLEDLVLTTDSKEEANNVAQQGKYETTEILDTKTMKLYDYGNMEENDNG